MKYLNYTTASNSPKLKDNIARINMNLLLLKEISLAHSSSEEMTSQLCSMKKLKYNSQLWPKEKLPSGKGWLISNSYNTKSKISKGNSKYSWKKEIKYLALKIKSLSFSLNLFKKNSKSKRFLNNLKTHSMYIDAEIFKALILMSTKWKKKSKHYKKGSSSKLNKLYKNKSWSIRKKNKFKSSEKLWKNNQVWK